MCYFVYQSIRGVRSVPEVLAVYFREPCPRNGLLNKKAENDRMTTDEDEITSAHDAGAF